jgi:hypothetical protein
MTTYRIIRIGSLQTGWAIERDGQIMKSHPSVEVLGAYMAYYPQINPGSSHIKLLGWGEKQSMAHHY